MPGNSWDEVRGDEVLERQERRRRATATNRGTLLGTFTRANRSAPLSGSRTITARFSDSPLM